MPLEEKDMDRVFELGCKEFLKKMEINKFYSYTEMSKLILENSIHKPQLNTLNENSASVTLILLSLKPLFNLSMPLAN